MNRLAQSACLIAALALPVFAQTQQVKPPVAVYWMSVETRAGMGMAIPAALGAALPPGMQGGKSLKLDLGSSQSPSGEPRASHSIPPVLGMGQSLPLLTLRAPATSDPEKEVEQSFERPRGRMFIYWGCGETVRTGQPVVIDFARLDPQEAARVFRSRNISRPRQPAPGHNRSYGEWPNPERIQPVPAQASLQGEHVVGGNYSPEIRFAIGERHDFMEPVAFDPVRRMPAGAFLAKWRSIPTALGYFATAMGQGENQNDVVMWSSSETQEMGQALMDYLPPAEVQRLVRDKVVMAPQTNECAVPAGIFKGEGAMLNFIAYGDELNVVHPPRPAAPNQVWEQHWAVKVRLKSTAMTLLAEAEPGARAPSPRRAERIDPAPSQQVEERSPPSQPGRAPGGAADAVRDGANILRGIFGR